MAKAAHAAEQYPGIGLFLWVYEANIAAQEFYEHLGATRAERVVIDAPDGGRLAEWRYVWDSSERLLAM